jgi:ferredoxin
LPRVTFEPFGLTFDCADDETLYEIGKRNGVQIPTACNAKATCGLCRVKVLTGEAHLTPINDAEKRHLGNTYFITKLRLSCQSRVRGGDVVVGLPDAMKAQAKI